MWTVCGRTLGRPFASVSSGFRFVQVRRALPFSIIVAQLSWRKGDRPGGFTDHQVRGNHVGH